MHLTLILLKFKSLLSRYKIKIVNFLKIKLHCNFKLCNTKKPTKGELLTCVRQAPLHNLDMHLLLFYLTKCVVSLNYNSSFSLL